MSDEKWVTLTPEQVEALDQGVIVRYETGDVRVQGPLLSSHLEGDSLRIIVSNGLIRYAIWGPIEVRERDVPKPELLPFAKVGADDLVDELADLIGEWRRQDPGQVPRASIDRIKAALVPEDDRPLTVEEKAEILYQIGKVRAALRGETS